MISALQSGFQGMQRASNRVDAAAADISRSGTAAASQSTAGSTTQPSQSPDIPRDMVNLKLGQTTYDANAKVVEVAAEMQRTLDKII